MAKRYSATYYSNYNGIEYTFELYDNNFAGSSSNCEVLNITYDYPGFDTKNRFQTIIGSQAKVSLYNTTNYDLDTLFSDILNAQEDRFYCKIYKNSVLDWFGYLIHDPIIYIDESKPRIIDLSFTDTLGRLQEIDFANGASFYSGCKDVIEIINIVLSKTGIDDIITTSDVILRSCTDWIESGHPARAANKDPLYYTQLNTYAFRKIETDGKQTFLTCFDVLNNICGIFGCRFFMSDGRFNIIQVNEYSNTSTYYRDWASDNTLLASGTLDFRKTVDQSDIAALSTGQFNYLPPLNKAIVNFNNTSVNFLGNYAIGDTVNVDVQAGDIIQFFGTFYYEYSGTNTTRENFRVRYKVTGNIASTNYINGTQYQAEWTLDNTDFVTCEIPTIISMGKESEVFMVSLPPAPADGTFTIKIEFDDYYSNPGGTVAYSPLNTYTLIDLDIAGHIWRDASLIANKKFTAYNETGGSQVASSYTYETEEFIVGFGEEQYSSGLKTSSDHSTWVVSDSWQYQGSGTAYNLLQLLSLEILAGQKLSVECYSGMIVGNFSFFNSMVYNSRKFVWQQMQYDTIEEKASGDLFDLSLSRSNMGIDTDDKISKDIDSKFGNTANKLKLLLDAFTPNEEIGEPESVNDGVQIANDKGFYIGTKDEDGSWVIIVSGNDLVIQKHEGGSYVTKSTIGG